MVIIITTLHEFNYIFNKVKIQRLRLKNVFLMIHRLQHMEVLAPYIISSIFEIDTIKPTQNLSF
jgi:hypothetical protein